MIITQWLTKHYYHFNVRLLAVFNPTKLFDRINHLTWYKKALRQWVDDQCFSPASNVLEAGCATGEITAYLRSL